MKVIRDRARVMIIVLCAFAAVVTGTVLPGGAPRFTSIIPTAKAAIASPVNAQPSQDGADTNTIQACPPTTIDGTIGSGSTDFPFVTGTQTSRLFRDSVESSCGTQKPTPSLTDTGIQFQYDSYTFSNTSPLPQCITVITVAGSGNQIFTAAYQDSFNPANVQTRYIGDAGNSDQTRSFSFMVDGLSPFVIVHCRVNNATHPTSLAYSFRVLGLPNCQHCPPTDISGTIGDAHTEYPKSSDIQSGRLFRNAQASSCGTPKTVPNIEDPQDHFSYDAFTFLNSSLSARCVTVTSTFGGPNQLFTVAYLDRFNPFDVQENYLGDAGNSNQSRTISFTVPGRRSFVIVQHRVNNAANPTSLAYNFSVSGLTGCSCTGVLSKTSANFADIGGQGSVSINIPAGCAWSVDNFNPAFVTIDGASSGSGNGTVNYTVAPNVGTSRRIATLAAAGQTFTISQGVRFNDVPVGSTFYTVIGKLSAQNITVGCGGGNYCPSDPVLREQMAAFIIRALGNPFPQVPITQRFTDVPPTNPFYAFIDEMAERGITLGCGGGNYCPSAPVLREQMAAFLIRALGEFSPPAPASQRFNDVPPANQFYNFIDRMAALNITLGCVQSPPQYCPSSTVTREQMAAFLVRAFDL